MSQAKVAQTRSQVKKESSDLLSKLPEDVKLKILECLPLQDAIKTGILSTHWRHKWAKLPRIILDNIFFYTVVTRLPKASDIPTTYSKIVNNVLLCHVGPLRDFVLYIPRYSTFTNGTNIWEWLRFVSRKSISKLTLVHRGDVEAKLPSALFFYAGLTSLTLDRCKITTLPLSFAGFPYLIRLELLQCELKSAELLESIISSCPQLQLLRLHTKVAFNLTIHAPKLEHLFLEGFLTKLCLGNETTNIRTLQLDCYCNNHFSLVFSSLLVVQSLRLGCIFFVCLWRFGDEGLINDLLRLETRALELISIPLFDPLITYIALKLLNCSQPLERLYCKVSRFYFWSNLKLVRKLSRNISDFEDGNFPSLKYVELVGVCGSSTEWQFIKIILECAPVLEVMTIMLSEKVQEAEEKLKITTALMQYSRASRNAQIFFKT